MSESNDVLGMEGNESFIDESPREVDNSGRLIRGTTRLEATAPPANRPILRPPPKPGWLLKRKEHADNEDELRPILVLNGM
jgi:hypothetical protein